MPGPQSSTVQSPEPLAQLARSPILVVGDAHTGATWVADVLSAHPQVTGLTELRLFSNVGLEPPFRDSHWNPESSERMFDRRMGFGQFLTEERVTADLRALADGWLARAVSPEHRFLVERSPIGAPGVRAFSKLYPDGSVIYVVRDGRELAESSFVERDRSRPVSEDAEEPPARWRLMWSSGNAWAAYVKGLQEAGRQMPTAVHELRYETLAARPEATMRELFELCGIPCDEPLLTQVLAEAGDAPQRAARTWSRFESALYSAGAGEQLHALGYAPPPPQGVRLLRRGLRAYERAKRVI